MRFSRDENGVTPVIGTILIMGITVTGMAGVLLWGAPAIQAIQDQGALAAMEGEFSTLRESTLVLREIDSARVPIVPVPDGSFGLTSGTRMAVQVATSTAPGCNLQVQSGWFEGSESTLRITATNCWAGGSPEVEVADLSRSAADVLDDGAEYAAELSETTLNITLDSDTFHAGDWRIKVHKNNDPNTAHVYVFLLQSQRFEWSLHTQSSELRLMLEGGALFRENAGHYYQLAAPPIQEDIFGTGEYLLRLPTYTGDAIEYTAPANVQALVQLQQNFLRIATEVESIRYDFHGDLSESWCNSLLLRGDATDAGDYADQPGFTCPSGSAAGVRSVVYTPVSAPFQFEFIQSRIHASLFL